MNLSAPFIKRPVMTTLVMAAIFFFGLLGFLSLPISDLPSVDWPTIQVQALNPGSDPLTMASTVATPLEQQIMQIEDLESVISTSTTGSTTISVTFGLDRSIDGAATDISAALNRAAGNLPPELPNPPTYLKYNPASSPFIFLNLYSDTMTMGDMYDYANNVIGEQINIINGVSIVSVFGPKRAVRVKLNPDIIAEMNLGIDQIATQVINASQELPAGTLYDAHQSWTLKPLGQLTTGAEYQELIVAYRNGRPVRIKDIGHAYDSVDADTYYHALWNNKLGMKPSVTVAVTKSAGANTVKVAEAIIAKIPEMERALPSSLKMAVVYNYAANIRGSIRDVELTLLLAFALVVIVIFLFLGNALSTIIPSVALPLSVLGTFMAMKVLGYSLDILSMLALILVVGFLVDDAIVVLENIVRHIEMGKTPMQAALDGSAQISTTIVSMTLSLTAVFIPVLFMPGIIGRMFHEFAVVVAVSILFSGFISLTLTPMLCSRVLKRENKKKGRVGRFAYKFTGYLEGLYLPALSWTLRHRFVPLLAAIIALAIALLLFSTIPQDFLPPGDTGVIQGITVAEQGISPLLMNDYQADIIELVKTHPGIESIISGANVPGRSTPNEGFVYVILKPEGQRAPILQIINELRQQLSSLAGIQTFMQPLPQINLQVGTTASRAAYSYYLSAVTNPEELYSATSKLLTKMKEIPSITDVNTDMQINNRQLTIEILREQANTYNITSDVIQSALRLAYSEGQTNTYHTQLNIYRIILQLENSFKADPTSLPKLWLTPQTSSNGIQSDLNPLVPLESVVKWKMTSAPLSVRHLNQFISTTIYFNLAPNAALGTAVKEVEKAAHELLPPSIIHQFKGTAEAFKGAIGIIVILMLIGLFAIYLLLGILYESFIHPLTIFSALPGALFGALVMLLLFNATLSLYAYVGIIVLIGIVMKNGIMLVEFANELVLQGRPALEAISEACRIRFRPILMTSVAAAMGAVPIALGFGLDGASRRPLGLVVLGGLLFAQLITYFFTPVVYLFFERLQERARTKRRRKNEEREKKI